MITGTIQLEVNVKVECKSEEELIQASNDICTKILGLPNVDSCDEVDSDLEEEDDE